MRHITSWSSTPTTDRVAFTFGAFDGIHLGHQYLFAELKKIALQQGLKTAVLAFARHPLESLYPGRTVPKITSTPLRRKLLEDIGIDFFLELPFTAEIAQLEPEDYVSAVLSLVPVQVWLAGEDVAFGRARRGNKDLLEVLAMKRGFYTRFLSKKRFDGEEISSSLIRKLIAEGEITKVARFLGRPFDLVVEPVNGLQLGKQTPQVIYLDVEGHAIPGDGIWTVHARPWGASEQEWTAATLTLKHIPALKGEKELNASLHIADPRQFDRCVEAHLLEIQLDILLQT